ncbi:hypothetical protein [Flocculibacter collagenilyticus]|uniref:hypothetical protein n=1 Tax=Flocculibacter collagenilyticus TaxID=2744479 RepID=UPI0018F7C3DA|nr:hypothetical protein [Flocculibacter collagenilyticus]
MIRLSKKGWNNVLIFSMLAMIMLFNGMHKKIMESSQLGKVTAVLPADSFILKLEYPGYAVERIGQSWRLTNVTQPPTATQLALLNEAQFSQLAHNWRTLQAELVQTNDEEDATESTVIAELSEQPNLVIIWLAGQVQGAVYALYSHGDFVYLHDQQQQRWFKLTRLVQSRLFLPSHAQLLSPQLPNSNTE